MDTHDTTPPETRAPFDRARLVRLTMAADAAASVGDGLHRRIEELRADEAKHSSHLGRAMRKYRAGTDPREVLPETVERLEQIRYELSELRAEQRRQAETTMPLRQLAQACTAWARRNHRYVGDGHGHGSAAVAADAAAPSAPTSAPAGAPQSSAAAPTSQGHGRSPLAALAGVLTRGR